MRRIVVLFLIGSGITLAQSTLPATNPTVVPAPTAPVAPPANAIATTRSHSASVSYAEGQLQIAANNSSLNQILREISRLTGMTITGGVTDQRVFGNYGPAPPTSILGDLLAGTGSNMFLLNNSSNEPAQLILTPRQGGPTPPNPNAPGFDNGDDSSDSVPPPQPNQLPARGPIDPLSQATSRSRYAAMPAQNSSAGTTPTGNDPGTNPPPVGTGDATSPNGVRTPQQIYEQLKQLQSAQPKQ